MVSEMQRAKPILLLVVGAVLLLYSMNCFTPARADAEAMECCATMPCPPPNQNSDCCKMVAGDRVWLFSSSSSSTPQLAVLAILPAEAATPLLAAEPLAAVFSTIHSPPEADSGSPQILRI